MRPNDAVTFSLNGKKTFFTIAHCRKYWSEETAAFEAAVDKWYYQTPKSLFKRTFLLILSTFPPISLILNKLNCFLGSLSYWYTTMTANFVIV